jgi:hypothetical protein
LQREFAARMKAVDGIVEDGEVCEEDG